MPAKLYLTLAFWLICVFTYAQSSQKDSLAKFQQHYKEELYSIIKKDTAFIKFYPVNPTLRVTAAIKKLKKEPIFKMGTSGSVSKEAVRYASVEFSLSGKNYILYAYRLSSLMNSSKYKDNFFIPFTDSTSGFETYGGGRYLDFVLSDITNDNKLIIDFNKAYNPYCAFASGYNCPIPPKENDLSAFIRAGEMNFEKKRH